MLTNSIILKEIVKQYLVQVFDATRNTMLSVYEAKEIDLLLIEEKITESIDSYFELFTIKDVDYEKKCGLIIQDVARRILNQDCFLSEPVEPDSGKYNDVRWERGDEDDR